MNEAQALKVFRRWVDGFPTKRMAAVDLRISPAYLNDLYWGGRPLTDKLLEHIGLIRQTTIKQKVSA